MRLRKCEEPIFVDCDQKGIVYNDWQGDNIKMMIKRVNVLSVGRI